MLIETEEVLSRYGISAATLYGRKMLIEEAEAVIKGNGGSDRNLYRTSVMDRLAREGKLGAEPRKRTLNRDERKEKEYE